MPQSTVVITGLGVVSSIGIGADAYFDALLQGISGITSLENRSDEGARPPRGFGANVSGSTASESDDPHWQSTDADGLWVGGPIIDFDAKQYVRPRKALKVMCREIQTAFAASQLAVDHAGLTSSFPVGSEDSGQPRSEGGFEPADIGTVFGSEMFYGPPQEMEDAMLECIDENRNFDAAAFGAAAMKQVLPLWMLKYLPNMPACHVGIALGAHGPNNTLVLGDVSGPAAMIEAEGCLRRGIAKMMVSGAVGTRINTTRMNYRGDLPIAAIHDPLSLSSRPYDPASRGVVGGEAAAAIVMENASDAAARGGTVIAKVVSHASRFIPSAGMRLPLRSSAIDQGNVRGSARAIESSIVGALGSAGLKASDISLVIGHGMGDPIMDRAEQDAVTKILPGVPVSAPIALIGHCGAACGTIGLVTGALAISRKQMPPTWRFNGSENSHPSSAGGSRVFGGFVMCLSHTPEGSAIAVILGEM